jgi:hypothetical protein
MTGIYHRVLLATEQTSEKKGICSLTGRDDELELDKLPNPKLPELNATLGASVVSSTSFFGRCISVPFYAFLATLEFLGFGVAMTGVASRLARALLEASDPAGSLRRKQSPRSIQSPAAAITQVLVLLGHKTSPDSHSFDRRILGRYDTAARRRASREGYLFTPPPGGYWQAAGGGSL